MDEYAFKGKEKGRGDIRQLLERVFERHLKPENTLEVAALIESMGWTDPLIQQQFGFANVFELAEQLWSLGRTRIEFQANEYQVEEPVIYRFQEGLRQFLRGTIFALPMVISVASMLFLRFSLWSYQNLSLETATAIALGTILSFLTVGGFMQAIARRGFFYIFQGYYRMAGRITFRFIAIGIVFSFFVSAVLLLLNTLFPVLPMNMLILTLGFYIVLNSIWLAVTAMYMLQREIIFTALLVMGIGLVFVLFRILHINILVSQLVTMVIISIMGIVIVQRLFRRAEKGQEYEIDAPMPRTAVTVYSVLPYFNYGFLYFLLLFVDRVIAWSTNAQFMPVDIWFRGDYEVGLDFALIMMVVPMGVSEVVVGRLLSDASFSQRFYSAWRTVQMGQTYVTKYVRGLVIMVISSVVSSIGVYIATKKYMDQYVYSLRHEILFTATTNYVFTIGLVAYSILGIALLNSVTMFSLSRPEQVLRPLMLAVTVDILLGFVLTRWINYTDAVWGICAGSLVFMILTTRNVLGVLHDIDYHLYLLS